MIMIDSIHMMYYLALDHNITTLCCLLTMYRFFIKEDIGNLDFSSLKHTTTAGEPLNDEVFYKFKDLTGLNLYVKHLVKQEQ